MVDLTEAKQEDDYSPTKEKQIIEGLKSIIDKRVETLNINDSVITTASYGWEQHIIVQIPLKGNDSLENNENIERAKKAIGKVVQIEFKERNPEPTLTQSGSVIDGWIPAQDSQGRVLDDKYFVNSSVQFNEAFQPMVLEVGSRNIAAAWTVRTRYPPAPKHRW